MSAPVISPSANPATTTATGATAGNSSASLNPLGSSLFANLLSTGMSSFSMLAATTAYGQDVAVANTVANTDLLPETTAKSSLNLQNAIFITSDDLTSMSQEDLQSLLANFGETTDELSPKILVAMSPGVPAKETFENIKAHFEELGIDTSKFSSIGLSTPSDTQTPLTTGETVTVPTATASASISPTSVAGEGTLTVDTSDAAKAVNFLLITTGFTPTEIGAVKDSIKSLVTKLGNNSTSDGADKPSTALTDNSDDVNASAAMTMMIFVTPAPKQEITPAAEDASFDLSSLSAFTQPAGSDLEEPDWTKKLSDKLGSMSLTDASSPFDADTSPFDDEMNAILSPTTANEVDAGFKGSISTTVAAKKEAVKMTKDVTGEISAQATQASNQFATIASAALQNMNSDGMLMANGNMNAIQNMSSSMSNPIFTSTSAIGTHPSVQAVAQMIEKAASGSEKAKQELTVQLDPPELGRMQVQLSMEKDGVMKVHLLTEKQETLSLFQRDSHALKSALDSAGIQIDSSSLTFDLASGDQSFNQLMGGSQDNQSGSNQGQSNLMGISAGAIDVNDMTSLDSKMDFTPNAITGNVHYSFWA